jgi:hypothetical protein
MLSVLSAHPRILAIPCETEALCPGAYSNEFDPSSSFALHLIDAYLASSEFPSRYRRWCEKTPKNIVFLGRILEQLGPNVRFINMVRDGRSVITSMHPTRWGQERFWITSERWIEDVSAGRPYDHHPQVLVVRYEDLVTDFRKAIRKVCDFVEVDCVPEIRSWHKHATIRRHPAWVGEVEPIHTRSLHRWRTPGYAERIANFMARGKAVELLRHYGYLGP